MESKLTVILLFVAFFAAACSGNGYKREFVIGNSISYEASLFRQHCAICHGQEANGKELNGKQVPSLRYGDAATKTEREIYDQISFGKLPMPAFNRQLSDEEIRKMVKFVVHDLQGRQ